MVEQRQVGIAKIALKIEAEGMHNWICVFRTVCIEVKLVRLPFGIVPSHFPVTTVNMFCELQFWQNTWF